jgi:hypothetical protein
MLTFTFIFTSTTLTSLALHSGEQNEHLCPPINCKLPTPAARFLQMCA